MHPFRPLIATFATFAVLTATPAFAVTLASGVLQATGGSQLVCRVTNLGGSPIPAEVNLLDWKTGGSIVFSGDCFGQLAPYETCQFRSQGAGTATGYCHVAASGNRVRASLAVVNAAGVVTAALPLTK